MWTAWFWLWASTQTMKTVTFEDAMTLPAGCYGLREIPQQPDHDSYIRNPACLVEAP